ncbi:MAG: DUF1080 domain-containing protein [Phycisphaerae bacterium]|nr:DUF1080 domain-containing protein [Phycisphaerae bacterium]
MRCSPRVAAALLTAAAILPNPGRAAQPAPNTLTPSEIADGWILLFDGQTTFGWVARGDAKWHVNDAALSCAEGSRGWLATTTEFADFVLRCRYRIDAKGNSGVFFRAKSDSDRPWEDGYEMQICDHHQQSPTGSIHNLLKPQYPDGKPVTTADKWQDVEIRAEGNHLQVILNGVKVVDGRDTRADGNAKFTRGVIGLQYHDPGMKIEFRDLKLKPLGVKPAFNGQDLSGWKILPGLPSKFSVRPGGILHIQGGPGQIATTAAWADFALQLDVLSSGRFLNSGVFFRSEPDVKWIGYEVQIRNQWTGDDRAKPVDYGTGGVYNRRPARKVYSNDREWFTMTIVAHGRHIATWVNGYQAADWTDERPPNSNPRRGYRAQAGVVSLQGHDPTTDLSFRNIRVAEYPSIGMQ